MRKIALTTLLFSTMLSNSSYAIVTAETPSEDCYSKALESYGEAINRCVDSYIPFDEEGNGTYPIVPKDYEDCVKLAWDLYNSDIKRCQAKDIIRDGIKELEDRIRELEDRISNPSQPASEPPVSALDPENTPIPSSEPTYPPSYEPTPMPTSTPTEAPSYEPTPMPTSTPTEAPSYEPTPIPSSAPTPPAPALPEPSEMSGASLSYPSGTYQSPTIVTSPIASYTFTPEAPAGNTGGMIAEGFTGNDVLIPQLVGTGLVPDDADVPKCADWQKSVFYNKQGGARNNAKVAEFARLSAEENPKLKSVYFNKQGGLRRPDVAVNLAAQQGLCKS